MKHRLHFSVAVICFLFVLQDPARCADLSYAVQGSLTFESHFPGLTNAAREEHFDLRYNSGRWKITIDMGSDAPARTNVYQYDGTNITYYEGFFKQASPNLSGRIETASAPYMWNIGCGWAPWLAFASQDYFQTITNGRALSFSFARNKKGAIKRFDQPVEFSLDSEPPHVPHRVRYITDAMYGLNEDGTTLIPYPLSKVFGASSPYRAGYLHGDFQAEGFTNIAGLNFPTAFEYCSYSPKQKGQTSNDLDCVTIVKGTATAISVEPQELDMNLPEIRAFISDNRFPVGNVLYRITNGVMPETNSHESILAQQRAASIEKNNERMEKLHHATMRTQRNKKILWLAVMLGISLPASAFLWRRAKIKNP